ncbi:RNA polymerase sigma factor [Jeotgalibacillus haloalkalitolerans]|uniref:RNA polymerase sigma factor n=1 Tax=Jeotgalibacillus haloalkalitolerans TaxID=3104292 RepID=A0ABU5KN52_9BACL|nr:RNA polymerase sigma factor [Jeotgalibacillus sp. HH7-29]MDZ5712686.1 RNA polymerase sigma factor [Jeotgalibacillus sp. HH7-29]
MNEMSKQQSEKPAEHYEEFKQLFSDHKKHVFAMALSVLRDFELAEDVMQEVFIKLFQHMKYNDISNTKAWLISVSRNTALDLYRKKRRELTGFDEAYFEQVPYLSEDPLDKIVLAKYLALLNAEERQIVVMKDISGLKHREIAKILDIPLGTAIWKYNRALKNMKKSVE